MFKGNGDTTMSARMWPTQLRTTWRNTMARPKLIVTGHGRHGKDTFCEALHPLTFQSSSMFVCEKAVYPYLKDEIGYSTINECYSDRHNHRERWYDLISYYNKDVPSRLARGLFREYDIYCGLRNIHEFEAAKRERLFDLAIWVDASERVPPEGRESITITPADCDIVVTNNGTENELRAKAQRLLATWILEAA